VKNRIRLKRFTHQPQVNSTHCITVIFKSAIFCRLERCRIAVSVSGTQLPFTLVGNPRRPLVCIRASRLCACTGTRLRRTRWAVVTTIRRARLRSRGTTSGQRISIRVILLPIGSWGLGTQLVVVSDLYRIVSRFEKKQSQFKIILEEVY
jgi:hypothetical protein